MNETFQELYEQDEMFEQREKQYAESAEIQDGGDDSRQSDTSVRSQHNTERGYKKPAHPASGTAADTGYQRTLPLESVIVAINQGIFRVIALGEASSKKLQDKHM